MLGGGEVSPNEFGDRDERVEHTKHNHIHHNFSVEEFSSLLIDDKHGSKEWSIRH